MWFHPIIPSFLNITLSAHVADQFHRPVVAVASITLAFILLLLRRGLPLLQAGEGGGGMIARARLARNQSPTRSVAQYDPDQTIITALVGGLGKSFLWRMPA